MGKLTKVIVEHPDGGLLSLPSDETSLLMSEPFAKVSETARLFDPEKLLRLTQWVADHSSTATEKWSSVQKDEPVEQKKTNDARAKTTNSSAKRNRRTHPTPDNAHSTASGQNALHWGDNQHPEQE